MANSQTKKKADLKIVILGAADVGKTTLIHRYIERKYEHQISTIGASFSLKQWGPFNVALWDTAGEERFAGLSSFYCRGAGAAILAYDVCNAETFQALRSRFIPLVQAANEDVMCIVVGTKSDLVTTQGRQVTIEDAFKLSMESNSRKLKSLMYFETSSLNGENVDNVFDTILNTLLPLDNPPKAERVSSTVDLHKKPAETKSKCAC